MFKSVLFALIAAFSISAQATEFRESALCYSTEYQDSSYVVKFITGRSGEQLVQLGVPTGETSMVNVVGNCRKPGQYEHRNGNLILICDTPYTPTVKNYRIHLQFNHDGLREVEVLPGGKRQGYGIFLPCPEQFAGQKGSTGSAR